MMASAGGKFRVPTLLVGKDTLDGYEVSAWDGALDRAGYPKSPAPGAKTTAKAEESKPAPSNTTP